jgi:Ca-activated chloride channel family protein
VQVPNPGIVNILMSSSGYGSVYLEENNTLKWIYNLDPGLSRETLVLLPGRYRVVYRAKNAREADYTIEKSFRILSGASENITLN